MKQQKPFFRNKQGRIRCTIKPPEAFGYKQGRFITKDGKVIFIGGPGAGGGTAADFPKSALEIQEYVNLRLWEDLNLDTGSVPVYLREQDLPPVAPGHMRVFHGTHLRHVENIAQAGLQTGRQIGQGEGLDVILGIAGQASSFGVVNVVLDVPQEQVRFLGAATPGSWVEIRGSYAPQQLKGFLVGNIPEANFGRLLELYREYDPNFGKELP